MANWIVQRLRRAAARRYFSAHELRAKLSRGLFYRGCFVSHYSLNQLPYALPPDPLAERVWLVDRRGQHAGPFSTMELALAAKNGLLDQDDCIWKSGLPCWYRAADVEGLLPQAAVAVRAGPDRDLETAARVAERPAYQGITGYYSAALPYIKGRPAAAREAPVSQSVAQHTSRAPVRTGEIFPPLPVTPVALTARGRMAVAPAQGAAAPGSSLQAATGANQSSVTRRIADSIANEIVVMLDRNNIKSVDDLTSDDRLRQLAGFTFDALPTAIRFTLSSTIGKPRIEAHIFDALVMLRSALLSPAFGSMDLRQVAINQGPAIARALDTAIGQAAAGVGTVVSSKWNSVFGSIWGQPSNAPQQGQYPALAPAE